ncbi:MAG TPA: poly-gamma-glutamate hydrolase family protein [Acidimicrobiia bacterium]|jgi:phage replication-related protein YjqB (UPF0714/DUF867 family)|nr:poly-gamma-glutamate hydrolase family protein [Acidimicrobiia bacterium]
MFGELLASPGVEEVFEPAGPIGIMALHGGLEAGTYEIARDVAKATGASLYAVVQPDDLRWHVPSIHFDPDRSPHLARFLRSAQFAVSIHGFGRRFLSATALLGGRNRAAAQLLAEGLEQRGFTAIWDQDRIPRPLRGLHRRNPVNLPERAGVQVELTRDLRDPPVRQRLAAALAGEVDALAAALG